MLCARVDFVENIAFTSVLAAYFNSSALIKLPCSAAFLLHEDDALKESMPHGEKPSPKKVPAGVLKKAGSEIVIIILCHSARLSFDLKHTLRYVPLSSLV